MISVIIPCYNYGHLIADTIQSVLDQTYTNFEVIVVDDGSADNTGEVVKQIAEKDQRVRYLFFENTGLGASRNRGMEVARGDLFQFLDADDLLEKDKFRVQVSLLDANPSYDIVYGSMRYFTERPYDAADRKMTFWGDENEWMAKWTGRGRQLVPSMLKAYFAHLSSPLFRRAIVEKIGGFDNSISAIADYDFLLRCACEDAYFFFHDDPNTYSLVRWHPNNMSKNKNLMYSHEVEMRKKLMPVLSFSKEAQENNLFAIRNFELRLKGSWKTRFFSGNKFSGLTTLIRKMGLEKMAKSILYGTLFKREK